MYLYWYEDNITLLWRAVIPNIPCNHPPESIHGSIKQNNFVSSKHIKFFFKKLINVIQARQIAYKLQMKIQNVKEELEETRTVSNRNDAHSLNQQTTRG